MWTSNRAGRSRLSALAGFLVLVSAAAAARPGPRAALSITPAAHDFGQVIVGAEGTNFQFAVTLPPGAGPTDALSHRYSGPNAGDFRDAQPLTPSTTPLPNACADPTWRSGTCAFRVEFIPQAPGTRNAIVEMFDTRGNRGTATLTGTGIFGCTMYESLCNYAGSYSGSFGWSSAVNTSSGSSAGPEYTAVARVNVDVSLKNGVVLCGGAQSGTTKSLESGRLDEMRQTTGTVSGPGLFVLEFKQEGSAFMYRITAACPSANITETTTNYLSHETGTGTLSAKPVNWSRRQSMDWEPASALGADLSGSQTFPHPEQDPDNGVTGTMTLTWSLKRN